MGVWNSLQGGNPAGVLVIAAIGLLTVPMIILHELAHFLAGNAVGRRVFEFSIGSGKPIWKRTIKGVDLILRAHPNCGHVRSLDNEDGSRWRHAIFVAAGPAVNLAAVAALVAFRGTESWPAFRLWGLAEMAIVANSYLGLYSLIPFRTQTASGLSTGSDGLLLWKLLTGVRPGEMTSQILEKQQPSGLDALTKLARRSRITGTITWSILLVVLGIPLGLLCKRVLFAQQPPPVKADDFFLVFLALLPLTCLFYLVRTWRRDPVMALEPRVRHSLSPLLGATRLYEAEVARIFSPMIKKFPQEVVLKVIRQPGNPDNLPDLNQLLEKDPGNFAVELCRHDPLVAAGRYAEAVEAVSVAAGAPGLSEEAKDYLEALRAASLLACEPTPARAHEIGDRALEIKDEGQRMHLLRALSAMVSSMEFNELMPDALKWAQAANEIYPHDATVHLQLASVYYELGKFEEAGEWLKKARSAKTTGPGAEWELICSDLLAKAGGRSGARAAFEKRLKNKALPLWMRGKIERALMS